jgi:hypothetical protein
LRRSENKLLHWRDPSLISAGIYIDIIDDSHNFSG